MHSRNHYYIIWIFVVTCCRLVHTDIGNVNIGLQSQLQQCHTKSNSLLHDIILRLSCLRSSIFRCLLYHYPTKRQFTETEMLCGVINSGQQLMFHTWNVSIPSQYSLYIDFLYFHFPSSLHCKSVSTVSVQYAEVHLNS